jgi:phytoene desaturase
MPNVSDKHIVIVGAGPGGLTSAMILAHRGFRVSVFEKQERVGGRNRCIELGPFTFDAGPTFLMMKGVLDEVFEDAGTASSNHLDFVQLEPMYRLQFNDCRIEPTTDREGMKAEIRQAFPGMEDRLDTFLNREKVRFERLYPCLRKPYSSLGSLFCKELARATPHLALNRKLFDLLCDYLGDERLALCFTFQAKYLGMSPWECPALFAILSYIEHAFGIYHTMGGLSRISDAMAAAAQEAGAEIHLNTPVRQIMVKGRDAVGVELESGERVMADEVVVNADFGYAMENLFPPGFLRKYSPEKMRRKKYSCSTFMLYLGVDKLYDMPHHTIVFADDYKRNVTEIFEQKHLSDDISFYVRNASITDPSLAPAGSSAVYVLVPVPNLRGEIDWEARRGPFRERVVQLIEERTSMTDLSSHIVQEKIITPADWKNDFDVYAGATFNLAHNISQMIYLRPHNKFEECGHCYLVGGGTHPGSGLPTIYESGRIVANMISTRYAVPFRSADRMGVATTR